MTSDLNRALEAAGLGELLCDVCHAEPAVGTAAMPGVPLTVAYGSDCLAARAYPYWVLVAHTAMCGGYDHTIEEWRGMVDDTLAHQQVTREKFDADVAEAIETLAAYPDGPG